MGSIRISRVFSDGGVSTAFPRSQVWTGIFVRDNTELCKRTVMDKLEIRLPKYNHTSVPNTVSRASCKLGIRTQHIHSDSTLNKSSTLYQND